jgi:hypothetical protein
LVSLALGTAVAIPVIVAQTGGVSTVYMLILALLWLETLALDVYAAGRASDGLAGQYPGPCAVRPVDSGGGGLGMVSPTFRNLETVFASWIVSHFMAIALLFVFLRHWPVRAALSKRLDRAGMWLRIRNRMVYPP